MLYLDIEGLRIFYKIEKFETYPPQEDSFMFLKYLTFNNKKVLDLGCGSGILGLYALKNGNKVTFADIDEDALIISKINVIYNFFDKKDPTELIKELDKYNGLLINKEIKFIETNLFNNITENYDIILFNPPYLPREGIEDEKTKLWVVGGDNGYETIINFLKKLRKYIKPSGYALLLYSSLSNPIIIEKTAIDLGYKVKILNKMNLFFEKLYLAKISLN